MSTSTKSFWSGIPGLMTAIAGILTGVVGLGTLAYQLGVVGDKDTSSNQATQSTPVDGGSGTSSASGQVGGSTAGKVSFSVNPPSVTAKALNLASSPETVTVKNQGDTALAVKTPQVSGSDAARFDVDADACITSKVPVDGSCTITVALTGVGEANATMTISADGASESQKVALKGALAG